MTTSTTTDNDNNTTTDLSITTTTVNATINLNNSSGDDSVTTDGTGTTTVNANNSSGDDTLTINGAASATVNLNNSTGRDDVDISDMSGAPLATTVNLNSSTGKEDNVEIAGTTVNATVNMNNSGVAGYSDDVSITGTNVNATVNLNNSAGNDIISIVGSSSTNATVSLNNSGGNDDITIGSTTGTTTATVNLNASGGTDIVNVVGATTAATVNLANSTGRGDLIMLKGQGTGTINATNSTGNDTLIGANSNDTITGGTGNDIVDLEGAGTIYAGSGNDLGVYNLSDHYSLNGGVLQSIHGDVDYYYGQSGTNTLRIVLTSDQASLALVKADLAAYSAFLATNPGVNQNYTFHFGAATGALTVAGWQTLQIAVVTPTIASTAREGQTLTASVTVTAGETGTTTYQWQISANGATGWTNIAGAAGSTYTPGEADENHYLRVQAVFTDGIGETVIATSVPTAAVLDAAPTVTTPTITGTAQEGQTLTASASAGQSDNPVTYAWYSSADNYANPIGSGPTYLVKEGDESFTIEVKATATNDNGVTASATGAATSAVIDAAPTITTPTITGTVQEGQTLTASASAGQSDNPVTYAWYSSADNYANPIGSGPTYLVKEGDESFTIEVKATATNDNGVTASATGAATGAVIDAAPTVTTPTITGTVQEGQTLTASASTGQSDNPVTYQWQRGGVDIAGATGASYVVKEGDEGHTLDVVVTATNEQNATASAISAVTGAVIDAVPTVTTPTITGTAQEGQTLTASASAGQSDNPVTYQWQRGGVDIAGATGASYVVKEGDEGHALDVVATATNEQGLTASRTSAATSAVLDAAPSITTPAITGTVQEGQTLTASASAGQSDNPVTYQWQRGGVDIAGATGASYVVKEGDEGHTLDVVATATNEQNATASATSAVTGAVIDAAPSVSTPAITGTAQEGQTLTASASAGQSDNPVTYAWYSSADNYANPIGSGPTYLVKEGDESFTIEVKATATNDNGVTASATGAATSAVLDAAPTVTTPTITGTVQEGQTLTASASAGQSDNPVTYAWYSSADNYANPIGSGPTYLVKEGDESFTIEVKATATNDNGVTASATGAATSAVIDAAPTVTTPTITGTVQEGQTLTASASAGQSDNPVTYAWYSSADNYTNPIGSGPTYLVKEGDESFTIEVKATATNDNGVTASATSAATSAVLDAAPTVATPTITGTVQEGQTLTASASAGQSDNPVTYAWYSSADNYANPIGSGPTYLVKEGDEGHALDVVATATNEQNATASATSAATGAVIDAAPNVTTPTITGTVQEGQTLTASASAGQSDNPVTYAWYSSADNYANPIGSGPTYLVKEGDEGHALDVVATATNEQNATASATSAATGAVIDAAPTVTTPTITGTVQEGQTLTASASAGQSDNPVTYAWYSSADNYANPIGSGPTYLVKEGDESFTIEVKATATNDNGVTASATGAATSAVIDAAPSITTPAITGTVQEGQTLTASASAGQSDNPVTYAWYSSADNYANPIGSGPTYLVKEGDESFTIEVKATATNDNGVTASATGAATSAVLDAAPSITTPAITGTVQEGQTLTASASAGQSDNPVTYQWQRGGVDIAGATGASYVVKEGDEGHTLDVVATATNEQNATASATSAVTGAVIDAAPSVSTPAITGTAQEGQTLTASATAGQSDNPVTYQWQQGGVDIAGATGATYLVREGDEGHAIDVVATATNEQNATASATSAVTGAVIDAAPTITTPTIAGTVQEGQTLTASASAGQSDNPVTYQWQRGGVDIAGATGASYVVKEGDEGHTLDVVATATNEQNATASATSAVTGAVIDAAPSVSTPAITGTAQEGQTLTASATAGQSDNPVTYQWQQGGVDIAGATGASYVVKEGDEGHALDVVATATNEQGLTASRTSAATSAVIDAAPTVITPTITGTVQEGQTLTASASAGQSDNPVTYAWYSSADNYANPIGSGPTYLVKEGDESFTIEVKATATNDNGVTASAIGAATSAVLDAAPTVTTPTITGTVQEGQTLTASASAGQSDNPVTYAWYSSADNYTNPIGSGPTYLVKEGDESFTIEVKATATNDNGVTASATSAATSAVLDAAPTVATPTITGTVQEGQTLTASASAGQSDNPVTYAWYSSADNYANPIGSGPTYLVKEGDEGHALDVVATATNEQNATASATSAATGAVIDAAPNVTTPTITGTVQEGQTLTASASAGQSDNPVTYAWYSSADNYANPIGSGPTYLVKEGDEGHALDVVATATNEQNATASATSAATGAVIDAAPTVTTPTITGTVQEGQTLTASASAGQSDNPVTYAWYSSADNYANPIGSGPTYLVKEGDESFTIEVKATATNDNGVTASATGAATSAVIDAAPSITTPAITGTVQEGQTLTASASAGQSDNPVTYAWYSSADNYANPIGSGPTYLVKEGDESFTIEVKATATNDNGVTASATGAATSAVLDAAPSITTPAITGTVQEGQTLTASASAGQSDNPVTYQWQRGGVDIAGATGASYVVKEGDEGHTLDVVATATNEQNATASATSAVTGAVIDAAPSVSTPAITGTAQEGQTLTASATAGQSDNPVTYQWQQGGVDIAGATGATYLVREGDEGHAIDVVATATNEQNATASATSAVTGAVIDAAPTITTPTIAGTVQEGQTLTASASAGQSDNPVTYAWYSSADNYANPIGSGPTYLVKEGDESFTIEVKATATNDNGVTASATGAATSAVLDAAPTVITPTITGTVQEGQTLTASASAGQSDNPVTYAWYSSADNYANPIGSGPTYLVKEGDESFTIEVKATATNDNGVTASATGAATSAVIDAAPTVTTPTITGTVQEGQTLTASASAGQSDNPVTYAWYSSADNYANPIGSGPTYLVKEGDESFTIEVKATATNDNGVTASATGAATSAVIDAAPTITTPTITGTAQEGQTLTASASAGQSDNPVTYAWYSSADNYANPIGSGPTYLVKEGDESFTIEVKATATNDNGVTASATGAATAVVTDITLAFTTAPSISGAAQEGQVLTVVNGTLNDSDAAVTGYQWTRDGINISSATAATYTVVEADEGHVLRVVETATDSDGGPSVTSTSAPTAAVTDIALAFTTAASISGAAQEGQVLTAVNGTLNDSDAVVTGYQWTRDGVNISGATSATYTVVEADETHVLRVVETATDSDGGPTTTSTSAPTAAVTDITLAFTTAASITGTAKESQVLTAVSGTLNDSDAVVTGYQWTRDGVNISGATSATYTVVEADETHVLRVVETATDSDGGPTTTSTSAPTAAVTDITLAFTTAASITGTAKESQVLTAVSGTLNDSDAVVTGYQWTRDGVNISGATSATYTVVEADETHVLRVVETATDSDGGPTTTSTSAPTAAVTDIALAFTTAASITGTAKESQVLTAVNGTLNDSDAVVTGYQWTRDGVNISGATSATYTVVEADETHVLRVVETATDSDGGPTTTSTSAPTGNVVDVVPTPATPTVSDSGHTWPGNVHSGDVLTASSVTTGSDESLTITYQWLRNGTAISGATSATYTVQSADSGQTLAIQETFTDDTGQSAQRTVSANVKPAGIAGAPINLGLPDQSLTQIGAVSVTVSGVPSGWSLNAGTNNGDGSWTVQTSDPSALTVTTAAGFAGAMVLNVTESCINADGSTGITYLGDNVEAYPASPIFAVSGDDTLTGSSANDEFVFAQPIGNDRVYNFTAASDTVDLIGFGLAGYSGLVIADDASGNAVVTLGAGETITLVGVHSAALSAGNFVFDVEPVSTNAGTMSVGCGAILPIGGTIDNTGTIALNSTGDESDLEILVRGATLQGGGQVVLSDSSQNVVSGGDPSAVLDNVDNTISGAGQFGNGTLTFKNEGVIEATGANPLVIDTRANAIVNTGTLAANGAGGLVVNSALTGGGNAEISGSSSLEFGAASDAEVSFDTGATGTLKLDRAGAFTGTVAGFAGYNAIDLTDLVDGDQATIGYAATANNSGGTLTLGDAAQTHSVSLALLGQYAAASDFAVASDGHGGTRVTLADPSQNHALTLANSSH